MSDASVDSLAERLTALQEQQARDRARHVVRKVLGGTGLTEAQLAEQRARVLSEPKFLPYEPLSDYQPPRTFLQRVRDYF